MDIVNLLQDYLGRENVLINEPMSKHTSFKTGGPADVFIKLDSLEKLKYVLNIARSNNIPIFILGNGSNLLARDKGIRGIVCKINLDKFEIVQKDNDIFVTVRKWK